MGKGQSFVNMEISRNRRCAHLLWDVTARELLTGLVGWASHSRIAADASYHRRGSATRFCGKALVSFGPVQVINQRK